MILFYVQHLLGSGHVQRIVRIASALAARGESVAMITGGIPVAGLKTDGIEVIQLEPIRSAALNFSHLVDSHGCAVDASIFKRRATVLDTTLKRLRPDVVVIETFPFGRRAFRSEIGSFLNTAKSFSPAPMIVSSVRDILQRRVDKREAETVDWLQRHFNAVMVHGDPRVIRLEDSFARAAEVIEALKDNLVYTGYISAPTFMRNTARRDETPREIIVTAGGGAAGLKLYQTALAVAMNHPIDHHWRFLVGGGVGEDDFRSLQRGAGKQIFVERNRNDFLELISASRLVICQAGYNTVTDLLVSGARALTIPFEGSGETEQRMRAERFVKLGYLHMLSEDRLSIDSLGDAVTKLTSCSVTIAEASHIDYPAIDLNGVTQSADWLSRCIWRIKQSR
ncbi:MAG: glycosyl transferase [marine bacterium B5-7]|nr:MAG: glycosyl transferase [marine bacterium B5-7]